MVIDMRSYLKSGNYADVFAVGGRAYKLFKSGPDVPPRQTKEGRRRVFESQCKAFRLAPLDPFLRCHTAEFHGVQILEDVIDADGKSIQGSYLLDCCATPSNYSVLTKLTSKRPTKGCGAMSTSIRHSSGSKNSESIRPIHLFSGTTTLSGSSSSTSK